MILFGGLYLLLAAVEDDAGVEILLVEWLGASHASALLAGRAVTNSCKGVDKVGGCCPADEGATRAVDSQVWVEGLLWSELVVLLEEMVFDVGGDFSEVDWLSVHERRILVFMLDSTTKDVIEAAAASPDVVDENIVELWYVGPERCCILSRWCWPWWQ